MSITFRKNVLHVKTPTMLALLLLSTLVFYCMNYEAIDSAPFNWVEYCQVKQHMMYVGNTVKMHRIQVQICPLFWDGRDDLYCADDNWSRLWWVSTSPFVQLSSPDVHLDHVLVWHFISKTSGAWFEEYSSEFS